MEKRRIYAVLAIVGTVMMASPSMIDIFIDNCSWIKTGSKTIGGILFLIGGLMLAKESGKLRKALIIAIAGYGLAAIYNLPAVLNNLSTNALIASVTIPKALLIIMQLVGLVMLCVKAGKGKIRTGAMLVIAARAVNFITISVSPDSYSGMIGNSNILGATMLTLCGWVLILTAIYKKEFSL